MIIFNFDNYQAATTITNYMTNKNIKQFKLVSSNTDEKTIKFALNDNKEWCCALVIEHMGDPSESDFDIYKFTTNKEYVAKSTVVLDKLRLLRTFIYESDNHHMLIKKIIKMGLKFQRIHGHNITGSVNKVELTNGPLVIDSKQLEMTFDVPHFVNSFKEIDGIIVMEWK